MVDIVNLTKYYDRFIALDNVNLHIDKGEIFGFVGPNGAGKTTTMKIMCGLIKATSGSIIINGVAVLKRSSEVGRMIGYVPDFFGVYDNFKVIEYMEFYASMYGMSRHESDLAADRLLDMVGLLDKKNEFVDGLSRGMKQRLCVARALIHDPELLVLDEPNSGLDPRARLDMKNIMKDLREMGKTVVISSHILPELSEMCTSVGIIDHGRIVTSGKFDDIIAQGHTEPPVRIKGYILGMSGHQALERISVIIRERFSVDRIVENDGELIVYYHGGREEDAELLRSLVDNGVHVHQFVREKENLESLFLEITGGYKDEQNTIY